MEYFCLENNYALNIESGDIEQFKKEQDNGYFASFDDNFGVVENEMRNVTYFGVCCRV